MFVANNGTAIRPIDTLVELLMPVKPFVLHGFAGSLLTGSPRTDCSRVLARKRKILPQIVFSDKVIRNDLSWSSLHDNSARNQNIPLVDHGDRLGDVVIDNQDPHVLGDYALHKFLDLVQDNRIQAGKGFVQNDDPWFTRKAPRQFNPSGFSTGQAVALRVLDVRDLELGQQGFQTCHPPEPVLDFEFKCRQDVLLNGQSQKNRRLFEAAGPDLFWLANTMGRG